MARRNNPQAYSDRLASARYEAVTRALDGAASPDVALARLAGLAEINEFRAYNVNSPNNRIRLIDRAYGYGKVPA